MRTLLAPLALLSLATASPEAEAGGGRPQVGRADTAHPTTAGERPQVGTSTHTPPQLPPARYTVQVQIVRTADDDGGDPSTTSEADAQAAIARANQIYRRNGGDVEFRLHPASNFDELIESTALNRDCILASGQSEATINANTDGDVDNNGTVGDAADRDRLCDMTTPSNARTAYGVERSDRIIVFSRGGNDAIKWTGSRWELSHPSGGQSWGTQSYVRMPREIDGDTLLAHELGHYLHNPHTFDKNPTTVAQAKQMMEAWAVDHPGDDPRNVFDADARSGYAVGDTPPDPRKSVLIDAHKGTGCETDPAMGTVTITVRVNGQNTSQTLTPDRSNIMSYFKGCAGFNHRLSKQQYDNIHDALAGNRSGLVQGDPGGCYSNGSDPGAVATTEQALLAKVRKVASCLLLTKKPLPWEEVMDVYSQPGDLKPGFKAIGGIGVHPQREKQLLKVLRTLGPED